jgi:hypothetical protein
MTTAAYLSNRLGYGRTRYTRVTISHQLVSSIPWLVVVLSVRDSVVFPPSSQAGSIHPSHGTAMTHRRRVTHNPAAPSTSNGANFFSPVK